MSTRYCAIERWDLNERAAAPPALYGRGLAGARREVGLDEAVQLAVEIAGGVALLRAGAVILNQVVGVDRHCADLVAEVRLHMGALQPRRLALALLDLQLVEPRLEDTQRNLAVLDLRALVLAGDDDARRLVAHAHRRVGLVDMLAALAGSAEGIHLDVFGANGDLHRLVADVGHHLDLGKGGLAAVRGVERRKAGQGGGARPAAPVSGSK